MERELRKIPHYHTMEALTVHVAFQGGGAKLVSLLGACEALKEYASTGKIKIVSAAGTSAGAIAAMICAAEISIDHVKETLSHFDESQLMPNDVVYTIKELLSFLNGQEEKLFSWLNPFKSIKKGLRLKKNFEKLKLYLDSNEPLISNEHVRELFAQLLSKSNHFSNKPNNVFDNFPIPVYFIASDLAHRTKKIYGIDRKDFVVDALLSSIAIPFLFRTPDSGINQTMDGGLVSNLPVEVLFDEVADISEKSQVLAIALQDNNREPPPPSDPVSLVSAMLSSSINASVERSKKMSGVEVVFLNPGRIGLLDFKHAIKELKDNGKIYVEAVKTTKDKIDNMLSGPPYAVRDARRRYYEIVNSGIVPLHNTEKRSLYRRITVPYTDINAVNVMQNMLMNVLKLALPDNWIHEENDGAYKVPSQKRDNANGNKAKNRFDAILKPEIALTDEVFYVFPFFLSYLRKASWGVIPYAKQVAIGVLIHKTHPAYDNLKKTELNSRCPSDLQALGKLPKNDDSWFTGLVHKVSLQGGRIWSLKGYLFHEILPLLLRSKNDEDAQVLYSKISCVIDPQTGTAHCNQENCGGETNFEETTGQELIIPEAMNKERCLDKDIMIVDLAHRGLVENFKTEKKLNQGYELIPILHNIDIDVGIGFSLAAYPVVECDTPDGRPVWKLLRDCAAYHLISSRERLWKSGIWLESFRG